MPCVMFWMVGQCADWFEMTIFIDVSVQASAPSFPFLQLHHLMDLGLHFQSTIWAPNRKQASNQTPPIFFLFSVTNALNAIASKIKCFPPKPRKFFHWGYYTGWKAWCSYKTPQHLEKLMRPGDNVLHNPWHTIHRKNRNPPTWQKRKEK